MLSLVCRCQCVILSVPTTINTSSPYSLLRLACPTSCYLGLYRKAYLDQLGLQTMCRGGYVTGLRLQGQLIRLRYHKSRKQRCCIYGCVLFVPGTSAHSYVESATTEGSSCPPQGLGCCHFCHRVLMVTACACCCPSGSCYDAQGRKHRTTVPSCSIAQWKLSHFMHAVAGAIRLCGALVCFKAMQTLKKAYMGSLSLICSSSACQATQPSSTHSYSTGGMRRNQHASIPRSP